MPSSPSSVILVASEESSLLDEVLRYLEERAPRPEISSAGTLPELLMALSDQSFRAVLLCGGLAQALARDRASPPPVCPIVLGREEHPGVLRAALEIGARGFVRWPEERLELLRLIEGASGIEPTSTRGILAAVWAPKGGSGASVVAAHLAWALRSRAKSCLLVDLDLDHGDQAMILGAEPKASILDLVPVADEMTQTALEKVAWGHDSGFRAVLAPTPAPAASNHAVAYGAPTDVGGLARALRGMRELVDTLVLDVPSGLGGLRLLTALERSQVVLVVTADLLALHRSRRAMHVLAAAGVERGRIHPVLNRYEDGDIRGADVEAVLGCRLSAIVPLDVGMRRAPEIGRLSLSGRTLLEDLAQRVTGSSESSSKRRRFFGERAGRGRGG